MGEFPFSIMRNPITHSFFSADRNDQGDTPVPPTSAFRITDASEQRVTDAGDKRITD